MQDYKKWLVERFIIERKRFDRSGVYAYTQRAMAYNSNKIEGSTLTPEQTASLFDNGTLPQSDDYYRAKDIEEMNGHFLMFNYMLDTLDEELTPELMYRTTLPQDVEMEMNQLLKWYREQNKNMRTLAEFHARYEAIHPFQDGNGRTGRMIMFRESLKNPDILTFIVLDENRSQYIDGLKQYREEQKVRKLVSLMQKEVEEYYQQCKYFMG